MESLLEDFLEFFLEISLEPWLHNLHFTHKGRMIMTMEERIKNVRENYPDVMTQQEFADALGVCKSIAYRLNRDGKVPYTKRQVRLVRYYQISKDDVIRYIENRYLHTSERYIAA